LACRQDGKSSRFFDRCVALLISLSRLRITASATNNVRNPSVEGSISYGLFIE